VIVVDASAVLEILRRTPSAPKIGGRLFDSGESIHAPHLIDVEVTQVLRRFAANSEITQARGIEAISDLLAMPIQRYPHDILLARAWELRNVLTSYDAMYVGLAELLDAPLVTCDKRLAGAPGHQARIEVI
jgi:predicted nucleic acid-binding protein